MFYKIFDSHIPKETIRKLIFLIVFSFSKFIYAKDITIGFGSNIQMHRTRVLEQGLPFKEIDKKYLLSPGIFIGARFKNTPFEFSLDISFVKYEKKYLVNTNFNNPNPNDNVINGKRERVPFLMPKINYNIFKKNNLAIDISTGALLSFQPLELGYSYDFTTSDSKISGQFTSLHPYYRKLNYLLGIQTKLFISKHFDIRLNIMNVFGNKKYLFKDSFEAIDQNNNIRKLEYGIYGGFYCLDVKLCYKY